MFRRANNHNGRNPSYKNVSVCSRWSTFEAFFEDMGTKPSPKHSLGRTLDMGNYEPGNVFWMTWAEQGLAQRNKQALLRLAA